MVYRTAVIGCPVLIIYQTVTGDFPWALGISNVCEIKGQRWYTWFIDIDGELPSLPNFWWLIVKTKRGYHVWLDVWEPSFDRALKRVYKIHKSIGDKNQLRIAKAKKKEWGFQYDLLVLRVLGKWLEDDIRIIDFREPKAVPEFYVRRVLELYGQQ